MKAAQVAMAALTGLFLACGTVVMVAEPTATPYAVTCLSIGIVGWAVLLGMILADRS